MDMVGPVIVVSLFLVMGAVFVYCFRLIMEKAMMLNHEAWKHAIHAQDDAWQRMNQERTTSLRAIEQLTHWNTALTQQAFDSGNREIDEARRFMETTKNELIEEVGKQVRYQMVAVLSSHSSTATPPKPTPTKPTTPPKLEETHKMLRAGEIKGS